MDVDQDLPEGTAPHGTPFDDVHTAHRQGGALFGATPAGVHTRNFFTPLYTETQETEHTLANTGRQTLHPPNQRLATINEADAEELAATSAEEAEAHRTTELEADATDLAAEAEALAETAADEVEARHTKELEAEVAAIAAEAEALEAEVAAEAEAHRLAELEARAAALAVEA
jgi:hypothetical protein